MNNCSNTASHSKYIELCFRFFMYRIIRNIVMISIRLMCLL